MKIIFVRHGHPNYRQDCLTELGHLQAAAAAERLFDEGIEQIFSSSHGRAIETAEYTARKLGIDEIVKCDFMREVSWKSIDDTEIPFGGHPWMIADQIVTDGESLMDTDWANKEAYSRNIVSGIVQNIEQSFDNLLADFGYQREGNYYRVLANTEKTIAIFSHGGSSSAALGHLLNLPFPFMCQVMAPHLTAITIITLNGEPGQLVSPRVALFNDAKHIEGVSVDSPDAPVVKERVFS